MDLVEILKRPEGKTLEFKRDLSSPDAALKAIVAFANTAGGTLLIGVEDRTRHVRGVRDPLDLEERVANLISDRIAPRLVPEIERMESVVGLGFVACQQYLNTTYSQLARPGQKRWQVVASPPRHSCGKSFASIVDAAANYWKHHGEWPNPLEARTREVIDALTSSTGDYVLGSLLVSLVRPEPPRLSSMVHELKLWRDLQLE